MREANSSLRSSILDEIRRQVRNELEFNAWFGSLSFSIETDGRVAVKMPNVYWSDYYERKYKGVIEGAVASATGREHRVCFVLGEAGAGEAGPPAFSPPPPLPLQASPSFRSPPVSPAPRNGDEIRLALNPRYVFENFIVGPSNRLAHAAALATAENPARSYNPLFLHGSVGLGKTHLLQAICHAIAERNPAARISYLSCEEFVNNYISAVKRGTLEAFRQGVRTLDVLLIDDIHFLADREGSQEEFFHTFNTLHNAQKQIILSSDAAPKNIPTLEDRLVSRFKWGMVAQIDAPTFEMRVAILRRKAEMHGCAISDEILNFIASNIASNIRELEGAILKLTAQSRLHDVPLSLLLARDVLRETIEVPHVVITVADIQNAVTKYYGIKLADLQSKRRSKAVAKPRQVAIYLARTLTGHSLEEIGAFFGGKDHTTVMYAVKRIEKQMVEDEQFKATIDLLAADVRPRRGS